VSSLAANPQARPDSPQGASNVSDKREPSKQNQHSTKPCAGWTERNGIIVECPELVTPNKNNTPTYHSPKCHRWMTYLRSRGFVLGDAYHPPKTCIGWTEQNGIILECGQLFTPVGNKKYHSYKCRGLTTHLRRQGFVLGNACVKQKLCQEWIIRDGIIVECGQMFTPARRDEKYCPKHGAPHNQPGTRKRGARKDYYWRLLGYRLGDSVRRKCAYRRCTNPPFDRIQRSISGEYYCAGTSHSALETTARTADRWAEKLAEAEAKLAALEAANRVIEDRRDPLITLAVCLSLQGVKKGAMWAELYPGHLKKAAVDKTKKLFKRRSRDMEAENSRVILLSESQRKAEAEWARSQISPQAHPSAAAD
jgi:hypothetical protein